MKYRDILWLNARNLLYIKPFNPKKNIRLANNKLKTKIFLEKREIPFPQTYGTIRNQSDLDNFSFGALPHHTFVIKPTHGSKGKGILIVKKTTDEEGSHHYHVSNDTDKEPITEKEIKNHISDIIDGKYTISNKRDTALIEEKLLPSSSFQQFCEWWLADIRVIVSNLVPVAAMLRVPTQASGGKANLAQGWVAMGIDIATWAITTLYYNNKRYTNYFPKPFAHLKGTKIEFRNTLLTYSSQIQLYVNLGYLALDWVITDDGPKLLEINARAGLEIQNVSGLWLKQRLDRISKLDIRDPEKWVQVGKQLFSPGKHDIAPDRIVYMAQQGHIYIKHKRQVDKTNVRVEIDLDTPHNRASTDIFEIFQKWATVLRCIPTESTFHSLVVQRDDSLPPHTIVLWARDLKTYYIQPIRLHPESIAVLSPSNQQSLNYLDKQLGKVITTLGGALKLKPNNFREEFDQFVKYNGAYNPQFLYTRYSEDKITHIHKQLDYLEHSCGQLTIDESVRQLYQEKILELRYKLLLHQAYKAQHLDDIAYYNQLLWWTINLRYLDQYNDLIMAPQVKYQEPQMLSTNEIMSTIKAYLAQKQLHQIEVTTANDNFSRIAIRYGKKIRISVSPNTTMGYEELQRTLRHEIDIHVMRRLHGISSKRQILKYGTGFYLQDEEGLANYVGQDGSPLQPSTTMYKKYYLVHKAQSMSFARLCELSRFFYPSKSLFPIFKGVLRIKKGIMDTSTNTHGAVYAKDMVYLAGNIAITDRMSHRTSYDEMMVGKIKVRDIETVHQHLLTLPK